LKAKENISFEKLKALAANKLPAEETDSLRQKIKDHPKWEPIYKGLLRFSEQEDEPLDDYLKRESQKIRSTKKSAKLKKLFWAISSVAAVVVFVLWLSKPWQPDFSKIDFHDAGLPTTLSSSENSIFNQAMVAFKQNEFEQAFNLFDGVQKNKIGADTLVYFKATSQKEMGNYKQALALYKEIKPRSAYFEKVEYQIAVCFAFTGEIKKAINRFTSLAQNEKHPFSSKAKDALKILK